MEPSRLRSSGVRRTYWLVTMVLPWKSHSGIAAEPAPVKGKRERGSARAAAGLPSRPVPPGAALTLIRFHQRVLPLQVLAVAVRELGGRRARPGHRQQQRGRQQPARTRRHAPLPGTRAAPAHGPARERLLRHQSETSTSPHSRLRGRVSLPPAYGGEGGGAREVGGSRRSVELGGGRSGRAPPGVHCAARCGARHAGICSPLSRLVPVTCTARAARGARDPLRRPVAMATARKEARGAAPARAPRASSGRRAAGSSAGPAPREGPAEAARGHTRLYSGSAGRRPVLQEAPAPPQLASHPSPVAQVLSRAGCGGRGAASSSPRDGQQKPRLSVFRTMRFPGALRSSASR